MAELDERRPDCRRGRRPCSARATGRAPCGGGRIRRRQARAARPAGPARVRRSPSSTESTFGTGWKTVRGTRRRRGRRTRAGRAPTGSRRRGCPARRRTARRPPAGPSPPRPAASGSSKIVRRITPAAIPYGRLAITLPTGGSRPAKSSVIASAKWRLTLSNGSTASRRAGSSRRSISTTWTWAARAARCSERTPRPPPISSTTSPASSWAARSTTPSTFESIRKFWPSSRRGRTSNSSIRRSDGWRALTTRTARPRSCSTSRSSSS